MTPLQWLIEEGAEPQFDVQTSARLLEMDVATLQTWAARGVTDFGGMKPGRSRKRLYSAQNLAILRAAHLLVDLGFKASHAVSTAMQIWIDSVSYLIAGTKRGEEWKYSEVATAVALIGAGFEHGPPNVRVGFTSRHSFEFSELFSGRPIVTFACGRVFEEVGNLLQSYCKEDA
jgi:hypothetical protein